MAHPPTIGPRTRTMPGPRTIRPKPRKKITTQRTISNPIGVLPGRTVDVIPVKWNVSVTNPPMAVVITEKMAMLLVDLSTSRRSRDREPESEAVVVHPRMMTLRRRNKFGEHWCRVLERILIWEIISERKKY